MLDYVHVTWLGIFVLLAMLSVRCPVNRVQYEHTCKYQWITSLDWRHQFLLRNLFVDLSLFV